jgi:flagellar basal body-associated protein FliL
MPMNLIKNKMSKSSKRVAFTQVILLLSSILMVVLLYNVIIEMLQMPIEVLSDEEAFTVYLEQILENYSSSLLISFVVGFVLFIAAIFYLVSFMQLSSSFLRLSLIEPKVAKEAKNTGNFLRIGFMLLIGGAILTFINSTAIIYISLFLEFAGVALLTVGYLYIGKTFKKLHEIGLLPNKEKQLIFIGQVITLLSIIPLSFIDPYTIDLQPFTLAMLIIAVVLSIIGFIVLVTGFYKLGNDAKNIQEIIGVSQPVIQVQTGFKEPSRAQSSYIIQQSNIIETESSPIEFESEARFCYNCGAKFFAETKFCKNCGIELDD